MCGIVGYVGHRPACDVVVDALRRMEYRGYDSAGVALVNGRATLTVRRRAGRLANLEAALDATDQATLSGHSGVGHTRWATHGRPTDRPSPTNDPITVPPRHHKQQPAPTDQDQLLSPSAGTLPPRGHPECLRTHGPHALGVTAAKIV